MSIAEVDEEKKPLYDLTVYKAEALERVCTLMKDRVDAGVATDREKEVYRLIQEEFKRRNIQNWIQTGAIVQADTNKEKKIVVIKK